MLLRQTEKVVTDASVWTQCFSQAMSWNSENKYSHGHPLNKDTSLLYYGQFAFSLRKETPFIFSKFNPLNTDTPLILGHFLCLPSVSGLQNRVDCSATRICCKRDLSPDLAECTRRFSGNNYNIFSGKKLREIKQSADLYWFVCESRFEFFGGSFMTTSFFVCFVIFSRSAHRNWSAHDHKFMALSSNM